MMTLTGNRIGVVVHGSTILVHFVASSYVAFALQGHDELGKQMSNLIRHSKLTQQPKRRVTDGTAGHKFDATEPLYVNFSDFTEGDGSPSPEVASNNVPALAPAIIKLKSRGLGHKPTKFEVGDLTSAASETFYATTRSSPSPGPGLSGLAAFGWSPPIPSRMPILPRMSIPSRMSMLATPSSLPHRPMPSSGMPPPLPRMLMPPSHTGMFYSYGVMPPWSWMHQMPPAHSDPWSKVTTSLPPDQRQKPAWRTQGERKTQGHETQGHPQYPAGKINHTRKVQNGVQNAQTWTHHALFDENTWQKFVTKTISNPNDLSAKISSFFQSYLGPHFVRAQEIGELVSSDFASSESDRILHELTNFFLNERPQAKISDIQLQPVTVTRFREPAAQDKVEDKVEVGLIRDDVDSNAYKAATHYILILELQGPEAVSIIKEWKASEFDDRWRPESVSIEEKLGASPATGDKSDSTAATNSNGYTNSDVYRLEISHNWSSIVWRIGGLPYLWRFLQQHEDRMSKLRDSQLASVTVTEA